MNRHYLSFKIVILSAIFSSSAMAEMQKDRIIQEQSSLLYQYQIQLNQLKNEVDELREQVQKTQYTLDQSIATMQKMQVKLDNLTVEPANTVSAFNNNWKPTGNDEKDYTYLVSVILEGKESKSLISDFEAFNTAYPSSGYKSNVYFWLGQLYYEFKQFDDASIYFAKVVKEYPKSEKAGLSLAKIGQIQAEKGDKQKAKSVYQQVLTRYANQTDAVEYTKKLLLNLK